MKNKRRDKLQIIANILKITKRGVKKTKIMYKANLSFTQLEQYLHLLLQRGLLREENSTYYATEKGLKLYGKYTELMGMLEVDHPKPPYINGLALSKFSYE